jgi:hypothetical protein
VPGGALNPCAGACVGVSATIARTSAPAKEALRARPEMLFMEIPCCREPLPLTVLIP